MKNPTIKLEPVHAYVVAEALAHAINSGRFKALEAPTTRAGRTFYSMFAYTNLAEQVLEQIASAGIINRSTTEAR